MATKKPKAAAAAESTVTHFDKLADAVKAVQEHLKDLPEHFVLEFSSVHAGGFNVHCTENNPQ